MEHWLKHPAAEAPCTVIAEVAQAHDGSLGMAHAFIDAIAASGAHGVKFQTHIADAESTPAEPWRKVFSRQDATRYDYWKRMEFTTEQWHGLKRHADEKGLLFLSSPFSMAAVDLLEKVGVAAWKVASGEVANFSMLQRMASAGLPIILSSGMSDFAEIDAAVSLLREKRAPLAILQCATKYPCPPEEVGLNVMTAFAKRYPGAAVGLSDHSAKIYAGLAAVTLGAQVVEVHATLSRHMFGPDVPASLTIEELAKLVEGIGFIEAMKRAPVDKSVVSDELRAMRAIFMKSLVAERDLPAGHILTASDIAMKKPGGGIPAPEAEKLVGRRLTRSVQYNQQFNWTDFA